MRTKKAKVSPKRKTRDAIPRNRRQLELRETALAVVALSRREGLKLSTAAQIEGIRPSTVLRYAGSAFKKNGKDYSAKKTDRIPRPLVVLDSKGKRFITVSGPRASGQIARYWNAVKKAQRTGDYTALRKFRGKRVPYGGFNFVTSPAKLKKFAEAGVLDFEKLYWRGRVA
jgi:hypothetical protein